MRCGIESCWFYCTFGGVADGPPATRAVGDQRGGRADVHYRVTGGKASKSPTIAVSQRQVT